MSIEDFIIAVFCLIDDELQNALRGKKLRQRGLTPGLKDSEIITMEIVGEFLRIDCDKSIWEYFKWHWLHFFPKIPDRSNFVRQAANLHIVKHILQKRLAQTLGAFSDNLYMVDGLPMPTCNFVRAHFSRIFKGTAAYGHCASKGKRYYGLKGHLLINSLGVIAAATFTPANIDERDVCPRLVENIQGLLLGDKGYMRPELVEELREQKIYLQTPLRENMKDGRPKEFLSWMKSKRHLIETVIGQLTERFRIEKVWARDLWHGMSRFWRKLLAHTVCIRINVNRSSSPLQFEQLITC